MLGGGQLGRMMALAARRMGYRVHTISPDFDTPTGQVADLEIPADYDDKAKEVIRAVSPYTMTSPERLNALILAARYVSRHNIAGDIVECGVSPRRRKHAAAPTHHGQHDTERHLYLFDVRPTDPATLSAVALVLLAAALLASWLPAWRATRVSPTIALRAE